MRKNARRETRCSSLYNTVSLDSSLDALGDFVLPTDDRPDRPDERDNDRWWLWWLPGANVREERFSSWAAPTSCVENDETDETSSSGVDELHQLDVEDDLFFRGSGGSGFPGNSVCSCLYSFEKSPYRLPTNKSDCPSRWTRMMNSYSVSITSYDLHGVTYSMLMMPHRPPHRSNPHSRNIDIPPMNRMPLGHIRQDPILIRPPIHNLHLRELYPLLIPRRRRNPRHHH